MLELAATRDSALLTAMQARVAAWLAAVLPGAVPAAREARGQEDEGQGQAENLEEEMEEGLQGVAVLTELRLPPALSLLPPSCKAQLPDRCRPLRLWSPK